LPFVPPRDFRGYAATTSMTERLAPLPKFLRPLFVTVDLGFIAYWVITLLVSLVLTSCSGLMAVSF